MRGVGEAYPGREPDVIGAKLLLPRAPAVDGPRDDGVTDLISEADGPPALRVEEGDVGRAEEIVGKRELAPGAPSVRRMPGTRRLHEPDVGLTAAGEGCRESERSRQARLHPGRPGVLAAERDARIAEERQRAAAIRQA